MIIWSSPSTTTFSEEDGNVPTPWIKPVIKLIRNAYNTYPSLKIVGLSLGTNLVAYALGGQIGKKSLNEAEKMARNLTRGIFCGKDSITLKDSFFKLPYVKKVFEGLPNIETINVYAQYEDYIDLTLPEKALVHGTS